jgi:hypothetical protein
MIDRTWGTICEEREPNHNVAIRGSDNIVPFSYETLFLWGLNRSPPWYLLVVCESKTKYIKYDLDKRLRGNNGKSVSCNHVDD